MIIIIIICQPASLPRSMSAGALSVKKTYMCKYIIYIYIYIYVPKAEAYVSGVMCAISVVMISLVWLDGLWACRSCC